MGKPLAQETPAERLRRVEGLNDELREHLDEAFALKAENDSLRRTLEVVYTAASEYYPDPHHALLMRIALLEGLLAKAATRLPLSDYDDRDSLLRRIDEALLTPIDAEKAPAAYPMTGQDGRGPRGRAELSR